MKVTLNLASRHYVNRRAVSRLGLFLILLLVLVLAYLTIGVLQNRSQLDSYKNNIADLDQQLLKLQGEVPRSLTSQQIEAQKVEFKQAQALLERDAFRWTALFDRMERRLPSGVSVVSFNPDYKAKTLSMVGVARKLSDLQKLLDNLHQETFEQVYLNRQGQTSVGDGEGGKVTAISFEVRLEGVF